MLVKDGELFALNALIERLSSQNAFLGLYKNYLEVDRTTIFAGMIEASYTGYARQSLTAYTWSISWTPDNIPIASGTRQYFQPSDATSENIYGYFIGYVLSAVDTLIFIKPFPSLFTVGPTSILPLLPKLSARGLLVP